MKKAIVTVVVVVIVAVTMVGCFISFVPRTREAAARTQCTNNLKMIGLAVHNYHDSHKRFPRALAAAPTAALPPEKQVSWLYFISPYIEAHMDPKFLVNSQKPWDDAENDYVATKGWGAVYSCPSNPDFGEKYRFTHYVGITGIGKAAAWLPKDDPQAGIFGYQRTVKLTDIIDGASTTIMVAETGRANGPWAKGGFATTRGLDRQGVDYLGKDGQFSAVHGAEWFLSNPSLTQVLMADGTVRTVSSRVSDDVFEALATYAGGEKIQQDDLDR